MLAPGPGLSTRSMSKLDTGGIWGWSRAVDPLDVQAGHRWYLRQVPGSRPHQKLLMRSDMSPICEGVITLRCCYPMVTPLLFLAAPIAAFFLSFTSHFSAAGPRYAVKVDYSGAQKGLTAKVIPPGEQAFTLIFTWPLPVPALRRGRCQ